MRGLTPQNSIDSSSQSNSRPCCKSEKAMNSRYVYEIAPIQEYYRPEDRQSAPFRVHINAAKVTYRAHIRIQVLLFCWLYDMEN